MIKITPKWLKINKIKRFWGRFLCVYKQRNSENVSLHGEKQCVKYDDNSLFTGSSSGVFGVVWEWAYMMLFGCANGGWFECDVGTLEHEDLLQYDVLERKARHNNSDGLRRAGEME